MPLIELWFACGESTLSVRRFAVREQISGLFEVTVLARSPDEDLDLGAIVGDAASLRVAHGLAHARAGARRWAGVCSRLEQTAVEPTGLSTYELQIVPRLWLLTQRRNHRVFQHRSAPEIAEALLAEWRIDAELRLDRGDHPRIPYRVQHGETDHALLCRVLEEAGISYHFSADEEDESRLILTDRPHRSEIRPGPPLPYVDHPNDAAEREYATRVRVSEDIRPGRCEIRDFDFRRPGYPLRGAASEGPMDERALEHYHYLPGAFLIESDAGTGAPVADAIGAARHDDREGRSMASRCLEAERASKRLVRFDTNALDLAPGAVLSLGRHPRADLAADRRLLVTESTLEGSPDGEWRMAVGAVSAEVPYRPPRHTPKPRVHGLQSAIVVGPPGEEIHTDEFGRVQVQFWWDRQGRMDEQSSCWLRVSQGWAGAGYGVVALPRVGQEVLVGFLEGDPDQPIVVGRVYNASTPLPYKLPEQKAVSTWKSASSPGAEGYNEIRFDDARGKELVYVQAERDLRRVVKREESVSVGASRSTTVEAVDSLLVGDKHKVTMRQPPDAPPELPPTGVEMVDKRICLTTGGATLTMEGSSITLSAESSITIKCNQEIQIIDASNIKVNASSRVDIHCATGGEVNIKGGPMVKVNCD